MAKQIPPPQNNDETVERSQMEVEMSKPVVRRETR